MESTTTAEPAIWAVQAGSGGAYASDFEATGYAAFASAPSGRPGVTAKGEE
jgi:hypothetical protein